MTIRGIMAKTPRKRAAKGHKAPRDKKEALRKSIEASIQTDKDIQFALEAMQRELLVEERRISRALAPPVYHGYPL
jgi:hypothetical protein